MILRRNFEKKSKIWQNVKNIYTKHDQAIRPGDDGEIRKKKQKS